MDLQEQYPHLFLSSGFLKQPVIENVGTRHAILKEPYDCGEFIIPAGFHFDGASMPTWTWSIMCLDPFGRIGAAALPHDLLYVNLGVVRGKNGEILQYLESAADEMFYERTKYCQMNWLQSRLVRRAVIWFGDYDTYHKSKSFYWNEKWLEQYNKGELNYV